MRVAAVFLCLELRRSHRGAAEVAESALGSCDALSSEGEPTQREFVVSLRSTADSLRVARMDVFVRRARNTACAGSYQEKPLDLHAVSADGIVTSSRLRVFATPRELAALYHVRTGASSARA